MFVPFPKNYSSLIDYQYYLVVTLKWPKYPPREYRDPELPRKKTKRKDPPSHHTPSPPPPQKKKKGQERKKKEGAIFANPPSEDSLVDEPL